jgi:hypothetical protein
MPQKKTTLIIIGAARSGTKFLRDSLAAADGVVAVPYDIGYVWRYGNESFPNDELPVSSYNDQIAGYIRKYVSSFGGGGNLVVEKTVANSLRVGFVRKVFPDAKFVLLIRDGRAVVESAYRQWCEPPNWKYLFRKLRSAPMGNLRYGAKYATNLLAGLATRRSGARVWGPRYRGIETDLDEVSLINVCARQWVRCVESSLSEFSHIHSDRKIQVRYEDFVESSKPLIDICKFADIKDSDSVIEYYNGRVQRKSDRWDRKLSAEQRNEVLGEIKGLLGDLNYI